jgi:AraC-like DNA-binding protein
MHSQVPDILFRLYAKMSVLDLEVLGYAVMSSRTVRKALEVLTRFHELTSDLYDLVIEDNGESLTVFPVPRPGYLGSFKYIAEENTAGIWMVLKTLVEDEELLKTCKVSFDYSAPDICDLYSEFFGCPVEFDAPSTAIFVPYAIGDMRINNSNRAMVEASSAICDRLMPRSRVREDLRRAVQRLLLSHPEKKMLKLEHAAAELKLSVSQLRKGLYRLGTSYKKISLEVRMALAKHYLAETNLKIDEIAYLLDYSHGGAFSRAFKTEFDYPPIEYRRSVQFDEPLNMRS